MQITVPRLCEPLKFVLGRAHFAAILPRAALSGADVRNRHPSDSIRSKVRLNGGGFAVIRWLER
jgi:hypothetical protein